MSSVTPRRGVLALVVTAGLGLSALAGVTQAQASTLYACVKKSGSAKISTKKPKCKKGERKLSWSTTGPAGKNGTNGSNGTDGKEGAAGALGGFSATGGEVDFTTFTEEANAKTILSRSLPAGSFIVEADVNLGGTGSESGLEYGVECKLVDTPSGGGAVASSSEFLDGALSFEFLSGHSAFTSVHLALAVTSPTQTSTIAVECANLLSSSNAKLKSTKSSIVAVQTTSNS